MDGRHSRRALLSAAGAGGLALVLPVRLRPGGLGLPAAAADKARAQFKAPLRIPAVLTDPQIEIEMRQASIGVLPGQKTKMWTYGGSFPGPTIRRPAGQPTEVTFVHRLPPKAGELTVHLHGGHNRSSEDGQPGGLTARQPRALYCKISDRLAPADSGNELLIEPGGRRTYRYDLIEDGAPERAAFQWYHDHRLERTGRNVWKGLAGMMIIDDELDASLPLPRGERDIPLMLVDRSFDKHNQLTDPFGRGAHAPNDGVTGRSRSSTASTAPTTSERRPLPGSDPQRGQLQPLQPVPLRRLEADPDRDRERAHARAGEAPPGADRPGRADRADPRLHRPGGQARAAAAARRRPEDGGLVSHTFDGPLMEFRVGRRAEDPTSVPADPAAATGLGRRRLGRARPQVGVHDQQGLRADLAGQRQDLRPRPLRRLPGARDDRDLGASQPHRASLT